MAVLNNFYPLSLSDSKVPSSVVEQAGAVCLVCAVGRGYPFVTRNGISPKKSNDYFQGAGEPRYPNAVPSGSLCAPWKDEAAVWMVGTAFAVGRREFITCWHVVKDVLEESNSTDPKVLRLVSGYYTTRSSSSFKYTMLKVLRVDEKENDYAEIRTDDSLPSTIRPFDFATSGPKKGDLGSTVGHPLGQQLKYAEGKVESADADSFNPWITHFSGSSGVAGLRRQDGQGAGRALRRCPRFGLRARARSHAPLLRLRQAPERRELLCHVPQTAVGPPLAGTRTDGRAPAKNGSALRTSKAARPRRSALWRRSSTGC